MPPLLPPPSLSSPSSSFHVPHCPPPLMFILLMQWAVTPRRCLLLTSGSMIPFPRPGSGMVPEDKPQKHFHSLVEPFDAQSMNAGNETNGKVAEQHVHIHQGCSFGRYHICESHLFASAMRKLV